jgi:hypothetical protein
MKRYKLLTETSQYPAGTLFSFEDKHRFMASLHWQMSRAILWEVVEIWN